MMLGPSMDTFMDKKKLEKYKKKRLGIPPPDERRVIDSHDNIGSLICEDTHKTADMKAWTCQLIAFIKTLDKETGQTSYYDWERRRGSAEMIMHEVEPILKIYVEKREESLIEPIENDKNSQFTINFTQPTTCRLYNTENRPNVFELECG